jgi:hypothetical protein
LDATSRYPAWFTFLIAFSQDQPARAFRSPREAARARGATQGLIEAGAFIDRNNDGRPDRAPTLAPPTSQNK